nr:Holliday junction branch migration protein RuvA [Butyrivibrio sp.]
DAKTLAKAPGIGKKTAERIVLELRDKIPNEAIVSGNAVGSMSLNDTDSNVSRDDAVQALVALGYNGTEAMKAVRKVVNASGADLDTEEILKLALKELF